MKEFKEKAKRVTSATEIVFDVRPLGDRQGEAVDSYLHTWALNMKTSGIGNTEKLVVLLCDYKA